MGSLRTNPSAVVRRAWPHLNNDAVVIDDLDIYPCGASGFEGARRDRLS
jgi:hypothetical protein